VSARTTWQFASVTFEHGDFFIFELFTHPFNGLLSRTTWVSQYQKVKTNLDFTEARDSEWQWHQLGYMQVCTSIQTDNHTSTHHSVFAGRMPFLPPSQGRQSTEGTFLTSYSKNKNCHHFLKHSVCTKKQVHLCKQKQKMFEKYFLPHSSTVNPAILTVISVIVR